MTQTIDRPAEPGTTTRERARRWLMPVLWANLVAESGIVVTGGLVRLTGSGLGCPDWPTCAEGSLVPTASQNEGFHKFIEFGNRTLTGVLGVLAILAVVVVLARYAGLPRKRMKLLAWGLLGGVLSQAVVGGITVRTGLNPWIVAFHFLCSIVMVAMCVALLVGARDDVDAPGQWVVHPLAGKVGWATVAMAFAVMVLGTIVTGSGPHSGDAATPARTGFDPRFMSWMHADAVMLFCGLAIAAWIAVRLTAKNPEPERAWRWVLLVTVAQGAIGYTQYFTKLPWLLVLLHMAGSVALTIAVVHAQLALRRHPL